LVREGLYLSKFYTAIASNDSARQVMEKEKLRELRQYVYPPDMQKMTAETVGEDGKER